MGKVVKAVGKVVGSVFKAVGGFVGMLFSGPKQPKATANASSETRLNATLVPEEQFKVIFGETAVGTDMRFWETFGAGNNGHLQVLAAACHEMTSLGNLYLDEKPVSFTGNNATGAFAGLLSRRLILKGVSGAGIVLGSGTRWTANSSMTGCSYYALIWTYNQEKLPQGIPSRVTQVGKGAKVYDPRRDSTRGGSGAHRADNPATWEYLPTDGNGQPIGRNNALQMLAYTLGIKALSPVTGQWELRAGRGADPVDIDFNSFIIAANTCEVEGWYSDCILSTGDSHGTNEGILEAASGGELVDTGGRFGYHVSTDDTANVAATFNEGDIVGEVDWEPSKPMADQYNELPGTFVDPTALFQTRPLPLCFSLEYYAADGYKKRAEPEKLSAVQSPTQGQKLLRRKLNRTRFQGVFTAVFNLRALKVKKNDIIKLNFAPLGFANKLFRVVQQGIAKTGGIQLILEEESPLIYLPGAVVAVPAPSVGYGGDPGASIAVAGLVATGTGVVSGTSAVDAIRVVFTTPNEVVERTEGRYKRTGSADWTPLPPLSKNDQPGWLIAPLLPVTNYTFEVRHVTMFNVPSVWATTSETTNSVTITPAGLLVYSNGQTVDSLRPGEAGANVTEVRTAALVANQGQLATQNEVTAAQIPVLNAENDFKDEDFATGIVTLFSGAVKDTSAETTATMGIIRSIKSPVPDAGTPMTVQFTSMAPAVFNRPAVTGGQSIRFGTRSLVKNGFSGLLRAFLYFYGAADNQIGGANVMTIVDRRAVAQVGDVVYDSELTPLAVPAGAVSVVFVYVLDWSSTLPKSGYALIGKPSVRRILGYTGLANDAVRFGGNVRQSDGVTPVTDASAITALGTASLVAGQGPLVTLTPPSYASNAAAITAGRTIGSAYLNTTTGLLDTVIAPGAGTIGYKHFSSGAGGLSASATVSGIVADSLLSITMTMIGGSLSADAPLYGTLKIEEGVGGVYSQIGSIQIVTINSTGLIVPGGSYQAEDAQAFINARGAKSGSVTYRVTFARSSGTSYVNGAIIDVSITITPPL